MAAADHGWSLTFEAHPKNRGTTRITTKSNQYAICVPCVALDSFARREGLASIAFLKIDVEGYEKLVLEGSKELIGISVLQ